MKPVTPAKPVPAHRVVSSRPPTAEERRRAQRVLLRIRIKVHIAGKSEPLEGITQTVSANGASFVIHEPLPEGTKIILENAKTQKQVEARVVRPPQITHEGALIPVEFTSPSPNFWAVFFPPSLN